MAANMIPEPDAGLGVPLWLRRMGFSSWLLVGFVLIIIGVIWMLGETSTIVMPVLVAAVLGAVAGPGVGWLQRTGFRASAARSLSCSAWSRSVR